MRKIKILILFIWVFGVYEGFGQAKSRLEFEIKPSESQPEIVPIANHGFIIFNPGKEKKKDGLSSLKFSFYDTNFALKWEEKVISNKKLDLSFYEYFEGNFYLLFNNPSKEELEIVKINPNTAEITNYKFYVIKGTRINDFLVANNQVYMVGL